MSASSASSLPAVTVLIPVYNGSAYVAEAVESALAQTGVEFEVVVGDNASTDDTLAIVKRYAADPRLRVLTSEKNLGIFGNLNRLVDAARAPYLKILCADDRMLPGGLAKQLDYISARP
jgi:O-antigen biosynthesis protein